MLQDPRIGYPSDECLIHIYRSGKLALTRKACSLLGLDDDSRIGFKIDSRPGRNLICIGTVDISPTGSSVSATTTG